MRIYQDPFENLLAKVIQNCAKEMNKSQPQDLTFIPDVVYLEQQKGEKSKMKNQKIRGYTVGFTRRTYGSWNPTTYTWLHVLIDGEWQEIGDPFPKSHYPAEEVVKTIEAHFGKVKKNHDQAT